HRGGSAVVGGPQLVVVDGAAGARDFHAELVLAAAAGQSAVNGRQHEAVAAGAIDLPGALELCLGSGDHQPVITGAVEVHVGYLEIELRISGGGIGALLVPGIEAKVSLAGE